MELFSCRDPSRGEYYSRSKWRCITCKREREIYEKPWIWFWVSVSLTDIQDEFFKPKWWLGAIGTISRDYGRTLTFTVMPLNVVIDLCVGAWRWLRFRRPGWRAKDLEDAYRKGLFDGAGQERAKITSVLGQRWSGVLEFEAGEPLDIGQLVTIRDGKAYAMRDE